MPIVQIQLLEGRSAEVKREIIYEMTETLSKVLGAPKESIRIIIQEIPMEHWGVNGKTILEHRKNKF